MTLTGILLFFSSSVVGVFWWDDFWKFNEIQEKGFLGTIQHFYFNWDGRALSPIFTLRNFIIWIVPYKNAYFASLLGLCSLSITAYITGLVMGLESLTLNKIEKIALFWLIVFGLWMGFAFHISTSIYWATGSYYTYANLFCVLVLYFLIKKPSAILLNSVLLITLGLSGVNLGLMILFFLLINQKLKVSSLNPRQFRLFLVFTLFTLVVVTLAPGNFIRASGKLDFLPSQLFKNYCVMLWYFLYPSRWLICFAIFSAFLFRPKNEKLKELAFLFLGLSLVYLIPFAVVKYSGSERTAITFQTMLFLGFYFMSALVVNRLDLRIPRKFTSLVMLFIVTYFNWAISKQIFLGLELKEKLTERYQFLEMNKKTEERVNLKEVELDSRNFINKVFELSNDPDFHANRSTAKFFSVFEVAVQ